MDNIGIRQTLFREKPESYQLWLDARAEYIASVSAAAACDDWPAVRLRASRALAFLPDDDRRRAGIEALVRQADHPDEHPEADDPQALPEANNPHEHPEADNPLEYPEADDPHERPQASNPHKPPHEVSAAIQQQPDEGSLANGYAGFPPLPSAFSQSSDDGSSAPQAGLRMSISERDISLPLDAQVHEAAAANSTSVETSFPSLTLTDSSIGAFRNGSESIARQGTFTPQVQPLEVVHQPRTSAELETANGDFLTLCRLHVRCLLLVTLTYCFATKCNRDTCHLSERTVNMAT